MGKRGFKPAKNARTTRWQDDVLFALRAAGLKPWPDCSCVGWRTDIYYYLVTSDRDVDSCEKSLLDAVAAALGMKADAIGRVVYQDSWHGSSYHDKEWCEPGGEPSLEVWVTSRWVGMAGKSGDKDAFNLESRTHRSHMLDAMGFTEDRGYDTLLKRKPHRKRKT